MFSSFMVTTWIAASIVAVVAGVVGFFVVVRGSAFAAHALPLGAFSGAALASLAGFNTLIGVVGFSGLGAVAISRLSQRGRRDVATALSLVMLLGMGALFLSLTTEYAPEVYSLLFGEVLGVSSSDLLPIAAVGALCLAAVILLYRPLLLSSVAGELAEARGIGQASMELAFLLVLALATAVALPVVGALLVFSLMVGPPAAARAFTNRAWVAMILAAAAALLIVWAAIAISYLTNWPVGFFVGALGAVAYGLGRAWTSRHTREQRAVGSIPASSGARLADDH
ncbi:MAG: metal ABC transporter permease [Candidatus Dormibacteraeota bacterium]|nr:metal ABC transporter permease [Candidatus Dormibacteraeota bacterium]